MSVVVQCISIISLTICPKECRFGFLLTLVIPVITRVNFWRIAGVQLRRKTASDTSRRSNIKNAIGWVRDRKLAILCSLLPILAISVLQLRAAGTWFLSPTGSDAHGCTNGTTDACLTFARGYAVASAGDTVQVAAGSYGAQTVNGTKGGAVVTFIGVTSGSYTQPCLGASAPTTCSWGTIVNSLALSGSNLEVDNVAAKYDATSLNPGEFDIGTFTANSLSSSNITIRNGTAQTVFIVAVDGAFVIGGSYGNYDPCQSTSTNEDGIDIYESGGTPRVSTNNVNLTGITMHDVTDHGNSCAGLPGAGRHVDNVQILDSAHLTIQQSLFFNGPTDNIIARPFTLTMSDMTIQNNYFGPVTNPGNGVLFGAFGTDVCGGTCTYQSNTELQGYSGVSTVIVRGNIMDNFACTSTYDHNVFISGSASCGSPAVTGFSTANFTSTPSPAYQNGNVPNYNLLTGTTSAHNAGNPTTFPLTDIYGTTRPSPPDAGAFQFPTGPTVPVVTTTAASSITASSAVSGGTVTSNGGASVTDEGVAIGTSVNPTSPCTGSGTGTPYTTPLTSLTASTLYHIRACAINSVGTGYGSDLTFTTLAFTGGPYMQSGVTLASGTVVK